MGFKGDKNP